MTDPKYGIDLEDNEGRQYKLSATSMIVKKENESLARKEFEVKGSAEQVAKTLTDRAKNMKIKVVEL